MGVRKVDTGAVPMNQTERMKKHDQLFTKENHEDSYRDELIELSLEQPSPLKVVDSFVSTNSGTKL